MTNTNIKVRKHYSAIGITDRLKAALATVEWSELSKPFRKIERGEITHEEIFLFNLCLVPERNDCAGPVDSCAESATEFRRCRNRSRTNRPMERALPDRTRAYFATNLLG